MEVASNEIQQQTSPTKTKPTDDVGASVGVGADASRSLRLIMEEDPLLEALHLTTLDKEGTGTTEPAFAYAAALINTDKSKNILINNNSNAELWTSTDSSIAGDIQQKAKDALSEVDRKLIIVESLSERISREKPEHVAAPLLKLHGFSPYPSDNNASTKGENMVDSNGLSGSSAPALTSTLDRCDRLARQSQVLDSVANRVESTLVRGLHRMNDATEKLDRVLNTSQVLKKIMRLKFEAKKVLGSGLDFKALENASGVDTFHAAHVDLRDLTRAAASVAVIEELMNREDLKNKGIDVVDQMRPEAERVARAVRKAAAGLLAEQHGASGSSRLPSATKLGATLQVYYHLGELPSAAWNAVCLGLDRAEKASGRFLNPSAIKRLMDSAKSEAKFASDKDTDKKQREITYDRVLVAKLREKKAEAASEWATGVSEAALQVFNLHRVLLRKSDPVTRQNFLDVVHSAPIPDKFREAQELADSKDKQENNKKKVSIFSLFWNQMCINLGSRIQRLIKYENGAIASDVATIYPSLRSAALDMLNSIQDTMQAGALSSSATLNEDVNANGSAGSGAGIMGGASALDDALFLGFSEDFSGKASIKESGMDVGFGAVSADSWTKKEHSSRARSGVDQTGRSAGNQTQMSSVVSSILLSPEWLALQGSGDIGLYPMQRAFMTALRKRLQAPNKALFVENTVVDENGIDIKMLPSLPSDQDLESIEKILRKELSIADPREGGGEFSMTTLISESIVDSVESICSMARGATSGATEDKLIREKNGHATEELLHDMNVAAVLSTLTSHLRKLPENTFVVPYRPSHSLQHEEASNMCQIALMPAIHEIENMVKHQLVTPLCNILNRSIGSEIAKMHNGVYIESDGTSQGSFVQDQLAPKYENIASNILSRLPAEYGGMVANTIAAYSIYSFVTNASLIRPLGEMGRLRITQDLADFELTLEQLVFKGGGSIPLNQISGGKPYAELRAVRQMLFWSGLESKELSSEQVSKAFFREVWVKDVRPSTAFHFLFTFAPKLLSSPHHASRMSAEEYARTLIKLDGSVDDGEAKAWMTTMGCCDAYAQRESIDGGTSAGDRRVPAVLMIIGPELLRRRRY